MRKTWICSAILLVLSVSAAVRSHADASFETWSDIATIVNIGDRWRYDGDQGVRGVLSGNDFTLLYFRPSARYRVKPWLTLHAGVAYFRSNFERDLSTDELRPWQGARFTWPRMGGYSFSHYFRMEERIVWVGSRGNTFTARARYMFGARTPEFDVLFKNGVFGLASIELFWDVKDNISDSFVNRIRWDLGVGSRVIDPLRVEVHYIFQDGRAVRSESFTTNENILRFRFFYSFN